MRDPAELEAEQKKFANEGKSAYKFYWPTVIAIYLVLYIPEFFLDSIAKIGQESLDYWHIIVFVEIVFTAVYGGITIKQSETGGLFRFGKYLFQLNPGLWIRIPGLYSHQKDTINLKQWEIPTDLPEKYLGERTIRMTTDPEGEGVGPLGDTLTLEIALLISVRLDVTPGAYRQFVERIGTIENFLQIADDEAVNYIGKEIKKRTPEKVFSEWDDIERGAYKALDDRVGGFGFSELGIKIKIIDLPHGVNTALKERTSAKVAIATGKHEGAREKEKNLERAEGLRAVAEAPIQGRVQALARVRNKKGGLDLSPQEALIFSQQEFVREGLVNAQYSIIPEGRGGLLDPASMMALMQEGMKAASPTIEGEVPKAVNQSGADAVPKTDTSKGGEK